MKPSNRRVSDEFTYSRRESFDDVRTTTEARARSQGSRRREAFPMKRINRARKAGYSLKHAGGNGGEPGSPNPSTNEIDLLK